MPAINLGVRPALTGLRAIAVILVLAHHVDIDFLPQVPGRSGTIFPGAFVGVDIFFVLSGFLITSLLLEQSERSRTIRLWPFWRDRLYRLLPALTIVTILVAVALVIVGVTELRDGFLSVLLVLVYGSNWSAVNGYDVVSPLGHTWSLAVEVQFYLVWPILILVAIRRRLSARTMMILIAAMIIAVWVWRAVLWDQVGVYNHVFPRTDVRADSLLIGALLSVAWRNGYLRPRAARWLAIPALAVLIWATFALELHESLVYYAGYSIVGIASAVLVLSLLSDDWWLGRALSWRPAMYVGLISYSLYLWHVPVMFVVSHVMPNLGGAAIALTVSAVAAALSYHFVEKPFLRLKRRLHPSKPRQAPPSEAELTPGDMSALGQLEK